MDLLNQIKENAKKNLQRIVLPESMEERTIKAADQILSEGIAKIVLIGNPEALMSKANELGLQNISKATIVDPDNNTKTEEYANLMVELRKTKGLTKDSGP
jgi:phosphate acetyltransferase